MNTTPQMFAGRIFSELGKIVIPEIRDENLYVSFGAAFSLEGHPTTFDQLYRKADSAMYNSKKNKGYYATIYEK